MRTLEKVFTRKGFKHEQHMRSGEFAIYKRFHEDSILESSNFELIRIQEAKHDHTFPNGSVVLAGSESYPSDRSWGKQGWTFPDFDSAVTKLNSLLSLESNFH